MFQLILAAALANSITAPPGLYAHAQWGATRPNVQLVIENRSSLKAWLVDVTCTAFDVRGAGVAVASGAVPELEPGELVKTWAIGDGVATAARFTCKVGVSDWREPTAQGKAPLRR